MIPVILTVPESNNIFQHALLIKNCTLLRPDLHSLQNHLLLSALANMHELIL